VRAIKLTAVCCTHGRRLRLENWFELRGVPARSPPCELKQAAREEATRPPNVTDVSLCKAVSDLSEVGFSTLLVEIYLHFRRPMPGEPFDRNEVNPLECALNAGVCTRAGGSRLDHTRSATPLKAVSESSML
jgi:hypothetical protein